MANHTHSSSGGGGFRVDLDMTDFTQEISEGIQLAIRRALVRIELECGSGAAGLETQRAAPFVPVQQSCFAAMS